jgi:TolB-like protein
MAQAQVRLLGGFVLTDQGGAEVALPTRKAQAVLAVLARRPGVPTARARLAALLWPDRPDAQGRASLRQALTSIRRALAACGAEGPTARGDAVALDPAGLEVDVAAFEASLAAGDLAGALARYGGALLDGFPPVEDLFDDWLQAERSALASRAAEALRARLDAQTGGAETDAGLALAERALGLDPSIEPAHRARMRLLAARGDRAGALREYERCRAALARSLGAEPSRETQALRRSLQSEAPRAAPAARRAPSLAVLPFEILTDDRAAATFARGLAEDICVEVSRFRSLEVIAAHSGGRVPGEALDPGALGRDLGAEYLLGASVRGAGGRLRVAPRLVEAATGRQVWADRYDVDLADLFAVQDRIARAVASALTVGIDDRELARARVSSAEELDAYSCWVRGMTCLRTGTEGGDREARALFARALEIDPTYSRAHAGLSLAHFNDWSCAAWERWDENEREAFRHAAEAARLDDRDHVAHFILGRILIYRREFDRGREHLERALALNPNDADVLAHIALGHAYLGDPAQGLALALAARRLHPFHPAWHLAVLSVNHFFARQPGEAVPLLEREPDAFVDTGAFLAASYAHLGDLARARENARRFLARFARSIAPGASAADAVSWALRVNPLRREADRGYLVDGLALAGIAAARGEASPSPVHPPGGASP